MATPALFDEIYRQNCLQEPALRRAWVREGRPTMQEDGGHA